MTDEELYLRTIEDLENRLAKPDEYNVIRAAALLRHLLIDGPPLLHTANRRLQLKLVWREFQVVSMHDIGTWGVAWDTGQNPHFPSNNFVKLDAFLASKCLFVGQHLYSVCDLIKVWANVRGGVHIGKPDEKEKAVDSADATTLYVHSGEEEFVLSVSGYGMAKIGGVVIEGLQPLTEALKAERGNKTASGGI